MIQKNAHILGIDIGSVSISIAEITSLKEVIKTAYAFHHGDIISTFTELLKGFDLSGIHGIASTSSTPSIIKVSKRYDSRLSIIAAVNQFHGQAGSILIVGGEKFGLISFDINGNYRSFKSNTLCAAGTGSFLDQQANRLNLSGIEEMSELAFHNKGVIPKIATRCAVFAKTDLVHAQQEGYSLEEICDGLCHGLARNIVDTLMSGNQTNPPLIFTGGVSRNKAVARHLQAIIGLNVITGDMSWLYGAIGAGLMLLQEANQLSEIELKSPDDIILHRALQKRHYYEPLSLKLSDYPDFMSYSKYEYAGSEALNPFNVEVDIYEKLLPGEIYEVHLGIDIGSTSTKAVLVNNEKKVLAGFYTRTAGRPVHAVQKLFAAIDDVAAENKIKMRISGTATTGAGRQFAGKIIGADLIIDEITAHARAAVELDPAVDTILEIGGQDAKFTTLLNGMVTFSAMNNVCAAGTGSFIEEQAQKLNCTLTEYSSRAEGQRAPISSDRCTVFMERDINHYLSEGYSVDEVLASVLHSIRENYLSKVAIENSIGNTICFQGATAKNRALVAAFEQRLGKVIHVSKYCHLTGALGAALMQLELGLAQSKFKGINLYKKDIPITSEVCGLCSNHCKLTLADIDGERVAYGFLCGRDYETRKFINNNQSGFNLLKARKEVFSFKPVKRHTSVGIPAALHMYEDLPMWKYFFEQLSIKTISSEPYNEALKAGKSIAGAEFCAPMTALYGHVQYLIERSDYVFLPFYLEKKQEEKNVRRQFCYYTQFSPSLVSKSISGDNGSRFLMPLINYLYNPLHTKVQLYNMLQPVLNHDLSYFDVSAAYDKALEFKESCTQQLKDLYKRESAKIEDIHVVFIGRPYSILPASMNSGIPEIFARNGVKTFYQDMLSYSAEDIERIAPLCQELPWHYASEILKAAEVIAKTEGAYPVFITSFKCTPDSFVTEYIKKLMESHVRPYLILQLDEHSSSVGYETRIEAAIRSFRNHHMAHTAGRFEEPVQYSPSLLPHRTNDLAKKTLIIPNWDSLTMPLIVANLQSEGIDARLMEETDLSIQKSLRHNSGQCIPLSIIAQEFIEYIEKYELDPSRTVLWIMATTLACNLKMFPHHMKNIFHSYGRGMTEAGIYTGSMSFADVSAKLPLNSYLAYMFGGLLRKMGCKVRPYEIVTGSTDRIMQKSIAILADSFRGNRPKESAVKEVVSYFEKIEVHREQRPKVAIFGDLYARDNDVMNQGLIHFIEDNGGEVVTTPFSSYLKMISGQYFRKWFVEGQYLNVLSTRTFYAAATMLERFYYKYFERVLGEPDFEYNDSPEEILAGYNIRKENTGESMDNILKIYYLKKHYPELALFVQASPAFCCPALVTEAMAKEIELRTGIPMVTITYDGTGGCKNDIIIPYLRYSAAALKGRSIQPDCSSPC
ncbi:MAG: CoA activase [Nitrospira sp.]|nr:CoA activase [bacterium]MBL7049248.1 CoA activase [Nitrospira sp.]